MSKCVPPEPTCFGIDLRALFDGIDEFPPMPATQSVVGLDPVKVGLSFDRTVVEALLLGEAYELARSESGFVFESVEAGPERCRGPVGRRRCRATLRDVRRARLEESRISSAGPFHSYVVLCRHCHGRRLGYLSHAFRALERRTNASPAQSSVV